MAWLLLVCEVYFHEIFSTTNRKSLLLKKIWRHLVMWSFKLNSLFIAATELLIFSWLVFRRWEVARHRVQPIVQEVGVHSDIIRSISVHGNTLASGDFTVLAQGSCQELVVG